MLDFRLMLRVKLPVVERIHPQRHKFATGVENKATGDSKLNDSPVHYINKSLKLVQTLFKSLLHLQTNFQHQE